MKNKKFYDLDHAHRYLTHSVIRVGKDPVYITEVRHGPNGASFTLGYKKCTHQGEGEFIVSTNDLVDMSPIPLGFLAINPGSKHRYSGYVYRTPTRMWKVGLAKGNTGIICPDKNLLKAFGFNDVVFSKPFFDMVHNEYPNIKTAYKLAKAGEGVIAFSRRFAVNYKGELFYRMMMETVGNVDGGISTISPDYSFLKEALEQDKENHGNSN